MNNFNRVFLIVLDSVGIGALPDAADFGDAGSNTLRSCAQSGLLHTPNLTALGLYNIDGVDYGKSTTQPAACYARMTERSQGKDTTIGHWEIAGIISENPLPTYPNGFPPEILQPFQERTGRRALCNLPYSGTQVLTDYGDAHVRTGDLIVYTSADSVFQIAAHEGVVPVAELYRYCEIARDILQGEHGVGRVIARPFTGKSPDFTRTRNRHDFSLLPPARSLCDALQDTGIDTVGVGKISDIFAGKGIAKSITTSSNADGMEKTIALANAQDSGLIFVNLVDFDMLFGHRNNVEGYTTALNEFDVQLGLFMRTLRDSDAIIITADHGCDPGAAGTDHSREYTPMLAFGGGIKQGINLGTRASFADISATILEMFGVTEQLSGESFLPAIR